MNVIVQGWKSESAADVSADLTINGNNLILANLNVTVAAFTEDYNSTVDYLLKTINANKVSSSSVITPVIFAFGRTGSGKSTTLIGDLRRNIPGLASSLLPGVTPQNLQFRALEWSSFKAKLNRFRDMVSTQDPDEREISFIPWETLAWGEFSEFQTVVNNRRAKRNAVHKKSSRGIVIIEVKKKSAEENIFLFDIPGLEGPECSGTPYQSEDSKWSSSVTSNFMAYANSSIELNLSLDKTWREIDAVLPKERTKFLLACIKRPYTRDNVFTTIDFLHKFEDLRKNGLNLGGSRRPLSPVPRAARQPVQAASSSGSLLQIPVVAVNAAGTSERSDATLNDVVAELRRLNDQLEKRTDRIEKKTDRVEAELRSLRAEFENHCRVDHQPTVVAAPRASPPPRDAQELPPNAAPAANPREEDNQRPGPFRDSTSSDQSSASAQASPQHSNADPPSDSAPASPQHGNPDLSSDSASASPQRDHLDSDESSSAAPIPPVPSDSEESSDNSPRPQYALRSRGRKRDSTIRKFPKEYKKRVHSRALVSVSSDDDDDIDEIKTRAMLSRLKLDNPQRPRIQITTKLSLAVEDPELYANTNFAEHITWIDNRGSLFRCRICGDPFETYKIAAHVWGSELQRNFICEVDGCGFVSHNPTAMRNHLKVHDY
ncbi:uncharacterized protein LOC130667567 [Microplitis mediator]|uniref:uncharacterized protein LOC130667567 n=1 Tax=Microplitis mediator TaxID=375433 RepID=UPI0025559F66|nr:uncharacterized protein LOC130667567 [Microplitis mediator]XP_057325210.1 uncharacterized protein LOC130667567 [Microplitis mediator]XP_057325211.1 uncharacterized protein LOC130667567 [Microplitis mediator]